MKILYTAFKGLHNSSYLLLQDQNYDKLFLTNSFAGLEKDITNFDFDEYDMVFMFGLNTKLQSSIRIEPIAKYENDVCQTSIDLHTITETFRENGVEHTIADEPTKYLCNYSYYLMLRKTKNKALFIHIPPKKYLTYEMKKKIIGAIEEYKNN